MNEVLRDSGAPEGRFGACPMVRTNVWLDTARDGVRTPRGDANDAARVRSRNTVGFYVNDEVLLEDGSSHGVCKQGGDAKLDANEGRADSFSFGEVLLTGCQSGSRVVGRGGRARLLHQRRDRRVHELED